MSALVTALALGLTTVAAATGPAPAAASWEPVHRPSQTFLDGVATTGPEHVWAVGSQLATDGFY
ncbi:MAG: hypothetical protein M3513_10940, partial [Actinomycetota bacterium]|nr:hypothetical protein [Actinomycetota bacterium]